ncbi:hypothetical protein R1sor_024117 [Riccia sorocarpa]|uniref:Uncharacterized protein n=1 Tax=Riccia sorocarpa TaxID=122646 RepID=A0ABD3GTM8_9MARC
MQIKGSVHMCCEKEVGREQDSIKTECVESGEKWLAFGVKKVNMNDQSRLDRVYVNAGGDWLHLMEHVAHHIVSEQVVSDHVHVSFQCQLTRPLTNGHKPKSYYKMDAGILKREGILQRIQTVWENHPPDAGNPQRNKVKWLQEGEALSRYFFAQLKAKNAKETIKAMCIEDGTKTTDRKEIMMEIENFMGSLYTAEECKLTRVFDCIETQIATPLDRFRYLGILAGNNILEEEIITELQEKYHKKLDHWANRLLTWLEKVLLAQNVLKALPNYILMAIGMSAKGTQVLERITADFLWGRDPSGKKKRPLIAWATFARKKAHGGLGWPIMQDLATAFLLKSLAKIIQYKDEDWIKLAGAMISYKVKKAKKPKEVQGWEPHLVLLALKSLRMPESEILDRMLKAWFRIKRRLRWNPDNGNFHTKLLM